MHKYKYRRIFFIILLILFILFILAEVSGEGTLQSESDVIQEEVQLVE